MPDNADSITPPPPGASPVLPGTLDKKGKPFDPEKHLPKMHPRGGNWMPKNIRKATPAPAPAAEPAPIQTPAPAPTVSPATAADPTERIAAAMAADMPPITGGEPAAAPAAAPVKMQSILADPASLPPPAPDEDGPAVSSAGSGGSAAGSKEAEGDPDADADVAIETLFTLVGFGTGEMDEARPGAAKAAALKRVVSGWLKKKGWVSAGGWAVGLSLTAYFLDLLRKPRTGATVRRWLGLKPKTEDERAASARNVTPAPAPAAAPTPAPAPKAAPAPAPLVNEKGEPIFGGINT